MTTKSRFTSWRSFPDPRRGGVIVAPLGPRVYDLRFRVTREPILVGISGRCAHRMTSLLPRPLGAGTRNNSRKRKFLLKHLEDIEYRTLACESREQAAAIERRLLSEHRYRFPT